MNFNSFLVFLDFSASADSKVVVLTINSLGNTQSYLDLVQNNVELFRGIIPSIAHYSQNSILLVASQPGTAVLYNCFLTACVMDILLFSRHVS